jgi:putative sigma-54 modulation protein
LHPFVAFNRAEQKGHQTMKVIVHGRNVEVTDWIEEYVAKRVKRLERHLPQLKEVRAELSQTPTRSAADRYTAQITMWNNGQILRAEETTGDIFNSIDAAIDKISRQIERFKGRVTKERRRGASIAQQSDIAVSKVSAAEALADAEEEPGHILRHKQFAMQPMNEEEALEQMELLGHDFFIFFNPETKSPNVIYKRKDGNYGVLQPQLV